MPSVAHPGDVKKMQETLKGKGHYRWEVDGVFGLRTRASIRRFQEIENMPVTGQLDAQTAVKLGVRPERRERVGYETTQGKPSAGIKRARGAGRSSKDITKNTALGRDCHIDGRKTDLPCLAVLDVERLSARRPCLAFSFHDVGSA